MKMKNWNAQSNKINIKKLPKFSAFFSDLEICCALIFKKKVIASIIVDTAVYNFLPFKTFTISHSTKSHKCQKDTQIYNKYKEN